MCRLHAAKSASGRKLEPLRSASMSSVLVSINGKPYSSLYDLANVSRVFKTSRDVKSESKRRDAVLQERL